MSKRAPYEESFVGPAYYVVEQGIYSPRDGTIGYRDWSVHETRAEAVNAARDICNNPDPRCTIGLARITEVRQVALLHDGSELAVKATTPTVIRLIQDGLKGQPS